MRKPVTVTFTWSEAANLLTAAAQMDTSGWTPAAKGNLRRALEALAAAIPMDDPNAFFLVVRGQTVVRNQIRIEGPKLDDLIRRRK